MLSHQCSTLVSLATNPQLHGCIASFTAVCEETWLRDNPRLQPRLLCMVVTLCVTFAVGMVRPQGPGNNSQVTKHLLLCLLKLGQVQVHNDMYFIWLYCTKTHTLCPLMRLFCNMKFTYFLWSLALLGGERLTTYLYKWGGTCTVQ